MAADERDLEHRRGKVVDAVLRAGTPRRRARSRAASVASVAAVVARSRPASGAAQSGERAQQRRLAGAVGPDDRPALAGARRRSRARGTACGPAIASGELAAGESAAARAHRAPPRASSNRNSRHADQRGEHADRQLQRARPACAPACRRATSSVPPASAAAGSSTRWSLPTTRRSACGTTQADEADAAGES